MSDRENQNLCEWLLAHPPKQVPMASSSKPTIYASRPCARLNMWSMCCFGDDPYKAPEQCTASLQGFVTQSHKFRDGEFIHTSAIVTYIPEVNGVLTYSGSIYILGVVDPSYERAFPNAHQRLIDALTKGE